jgi:hypothetical protein
LRDSAAVGELSLREVGPTPDASDRAREIEVARHIGILVPDVTPQVTTRTSVDDSFGHGRYVDWAQSCSESPGDSEHDCARGK